MKPLSGGIPIELDAAIGNTIVNTGITFNSPPYSEISRVPPFVNHADNQKQHARRDAVVDLPQDGSGDAHRM